MADSFNKFPVGTQQFSGFTSDSANAQPDYVSGNCRNMLVTDDGSVEQRKGYREEFSIGVADKEPTAFYHPTYDCVFFALGTKVFYRNMTTEETFDTGITLTDGTTTRFAEFFGDVWLTNTTDGITRIMVSRVNDSAANLGDGNITIDADGAARLSAFGDTSGNIRIDGVNEAYSSLNVSTGVLTLTGTLSQSYADNAIAIFIDSYNIEDASKIVFWKARMHLMGFPNTTNADAPNNSVITGQFVLNNIQEIENIVDFTFGTGGSTRITVSGGGKVTNTLGVADYIYFFTQEKVFATAAGNISTSGASIGLTIPDEKDSLHGCVNEDSATVTGNSAVTYITNDKRIMEIPIDTESGAALSAPREDFDVDIRDILVNMDDDQSLAFAYYYKAGRQTIYQVSVNGQYIWLIRDHNIIRRMGSNFVRGAWQPPQYIIPFKSLFERNGVLYGTTDNKVYSIFTTFTDDLKPIEAIFSTGDLNVGNAYTQRAELQGVINQPSMVKMKCYVANEAGGEQSGSEKIVDGSAYTYSADFSVGAVPVGGAAAGESTQVAKWKRAFDVFPSESNRVRLEVTNFEDGGYFSINSYLLDGKQYSQAFSKSL